MKKLITLALLILPLSLCFLACSKTADKGQVKGELEAVYKEYLGAVRRGDKAAVDRLIADDFSAVYKGTSYDKARWTERVPARPDIASEDISHTEVVSSSSDNAVMTFDDKTTFNDGKPPYSDHMTVTFSKGKSGWQIKAMKGQDY